MVDADWDDDGEAERENEREVEKAAREDAEAEENEGERERRKHTVINPGGEWFSAPRARRNDVQSKFFPMIINLIERAPASCATRAVFSFFRAHCGVEAVATAEEIGGKMRVGGSMYSV